MRIVLALLAMAFLGLAAAMVLPDILGGWFPDPLAFGIPAAGTVLAGIAAALFPSAETPEIPANAGAGAALEPVRGG